MAFLASHDSIIGHPKTLELMNLMGWDTDTAVGKLHRFWWWCLKYAPNGDLRKYNDAVLAGSVGLAAEDGSRFVRSMVASRWIDRGGGVFRVHHWLHYAGRYLQESLYKRHPELWEEAQQIHAAQAVIDDADAVHGLSTDKPQFARDNNLSINQSTTRGEPPDGGEGGFVEFWQAWPMAGRKADRAGCLKVWKSRKLSRISEDILSGLMRWKASAEWAKEGGQFIPAPIGWLRKSRWEAHPEPTKPVADEKGFVRREFTDEELRTDLGLTDDELKELGAM